MYFKDFKHFIASRREREKKPEIICIQESWLKPNLDFVLDGYVAIRQIDKKVEGVAYS